MLPRDAAAGADVDVVKTHCAQILGAANVVTVVGVAPVDHDVALFKMRA